MENPCDTHSIEDMLFAYWMKRQDEHLAKTKGQKVPEFIRNELERLRPLRNPNASIYYIRPLTIHPTV
jgi:hypothetical protein